MCPFRKEQGTVEAVQRPQLVERAIREWIHTSLVRLCRVSVVGFDCFEPLEKVGLALGLLLHGGIRLAELGLVLGKSVRGKLVPARASDGGRQQREHGPLSTLRRGCCRVGAPARRRVRSPISL